jgi:FKBP-type peptidyl-prolyl cis-trans isomerase
MKRLSKKEWIGVGLAVVVVVIFFNKSFFSFLNPQPAPSTGTVNNQVQNMPENQSGDLVVKDLVVGNGKEVKKGSQATVHYTGTFANGVKFDSSYDSGNPLQFNVGARQLIPGFDDGVIGMKVGGKRQLTIPPALAYGPEGRPPVIPPNSTLIFTIEVVDVK